MDETDVDAFEELLQKTVEQLKFSSETKEFEKYFSKFNVGRKQKWAGCYRTKSGINTNMYVESFHRLLKYVYMRGRINKRVDKLLHILMKVARDKGFERLCKLEKGKISGRLSLIRKRHFESTRLSDTSVTQVNSSQWMVTSSDSTRQYTICEDMKVCSINCHLQCSICNICVHSFSCNCMDALINHTICKHIHLVAKQNKNTKIHPKNITVNLGDCLPINEIRTSLLETTVEQQQVEVANIRKRVLEKVMILMSQVEQCTNTEALLAAERNSRKKYNFSHICFKCNR